jgi:hypothetical protein
MIVQTNTAKFEKLLNNIVDYSIGFLDGVQLGKKEFLNNLGRSTIQALQAYVDLEARANPQALHHVYEWYQTGSPNARLYDFDYTVSNLGLSFKSSFSQSRTVAQDSNVPFFNKASVMEKGTPVLIKPKNNVLAFKNNGETVFTKKAITVENPGGAYVQGSFERISDEFFKVYFKQSFLRASGLYDYINNPVLYKKNMKAGSVSGKIKGRSTGFKWIANARIGVE